MNGRQLLLHTLRAAGRTTLEVARSLIPDAEPMDVSPRPPPDTLEARSPNSLLSWEELSEHVEALTEAARAQDPVATAAALEAEAHRAEVLRGLFRGLLEEDKPLPPVLQRDVQRGAPEATDALFCVALDCLSDGAWALAGRALALLPESVSLTAHGDWVESAVDRGLATGAPLPDEVSQALEAAGLLPTVDRPPDTNVETHLRALLRRRPEEATDFLLREGFEPVDVELGLKDLLRAEVERPGPTDWALVAGLGVVLPPVALAQLGPRFAKTLRDAANVDPHARRLAVRLGAQPPESRAPEPRPLDASLRVLSALELELRNLAHASSQAAFADVYRDALRVDGPAALERFARLDARGTAVLDAAVRAGQWNTQEQAWLELLGQDGYAELLAARLAWALANGGARPGDESVTRTFDALQEELLELPDGWVRSELGRAALQHAREMRDRDEARAWVRPWLMAFSEEVRGPDVERLIATGQTPKAPGLVRDQMLNVYAVAPTAADVVQNLYLLAPTPDEAYEAVLAMLKAELSAPRLSRLEMLFELLPPSRIGAAVERLHGPLAPLYRQALREAGPTNAESAAWKATLLTHQGQSIGVLDLMEALQETSRRLRANGHPDEAEALHLWAREQFYERADGTWRRALEAELSRLCFRTEPMSLRSLRHFERVLGWELWKGTPGPPGTNGGRPADVRERQFQDALGLHLTRLGLSGRTEVDALEARYRDFLHPSWYAPGFRRPSLEELDAAARLRRTLWRAAHLAPDASDLPFDDAERVAFQSFVHDALERMAPLTHARADVERALTEAAATLDPSQAPPFRATVLRYLDAAQS